MEGTVLARQESDISEKMSIATQAIETVKKGEVTELKSLNSPPVLVKEVLEQVLILLNKSDLSWKGAKNEMASPNFLRRFSQHQIGSIPEAKYKAVD